MKHKVAFKTLGCRLNQFETDSLVTDFSNAGYEIVDYTSDADVYIVNTCTVTNQGDRKSKYAINQAGRNIKNPIIVVTGCMVSNQPKVFDSNCSISYTIDNTHKSSILSIVEAHFRGEIINPETLPQEVFNYSVVEKGFHTRSAVKIQDGCDNFCTYCIVPTVRGKALSRPVNDILMNIQSLLDLGNKEIVLTGVNISRYEYGDIHFADLIEKIIGLPGNFRVRVSSVEPEGFNDKLYELFRNPKLCPQLHICLQSGSNQVLLRMRRFYTVPQYLEIIREFKKRYPYFSFTTDMIVGFPGETDKEFIESLNIAREVGFSHIHTFKYSKRSGTRAERMVDQVSEQVKTERSAIMRQLSDKMKMKHRMSFLGRTQNMLVERINSRGGARGYGENFIPILVNNNELLQNSFYPVKIDKILDDKEMTAVGLLLEEKKA
jgi:threonylcarbamoyladenosine tRNA methylthiotransferase MtaB